MKKNLYFISLFCIFTILLGTSINARVTKNDLSRPTQQNKANSPLIVVDGQKDAFFSTLKGPDDGFLNIRSFANNDNGRPRNDSDLSAKVWAAWDQDWFYIYTEVMDNIVNCNNSANEWANDCFELKFDAQPTDSTRNSIWPVTLTAIGHGYGGTTAAADADSMNTVADSLKQFSRNHLVPGGYVLELALKWTAIGHVNPEQNESIKPEVGTIFGLAVMVHDNDVNARKASIEWAATRLDAAWNNPKYLGTVKLLADNKIQFIPQSTPTPWRINTIPYDGSDMPATDVKENITIPANFALQQNYPNPFNPVTNIQFDIPVTCDVRLALYDVLGNKVKEIAAGNYQAGSHKVKLDASGLGSGVYFYRLEAGQFTASKKLLLLK